MSHSAKEYHRLSKKIFFMTTITIWKIEWPGPSIMSRNEGLSSNYDCICIHMPIFSTVFDTSTKFNPREVFFVSYEDDDSEAEPMKYHYYALNDIVFLDKVHRCSQRAKVYTSLVPL